jgi:hypothetical protein
MAFAIVCRDKPDHAAVRADNRPAHLDHLNAHKDRILAAGPLLSDDGERPVGSLLLMDFETAAEAEAFAAADPYAKAGLFAEVSITPWRKVLP